MLDVPRELVRHLAGLLAAERRACGTRRKTRALTCWYHALLVLVWYRNGDDLTLLAAGFGVSRATAYRYRDEATRVLTAAAPDLHDALRRVAADGWSHIIVDGKVFTTHDLTVAHHHDVLAALYWSAAELNLPALADSGYEGAGHGVYTPIKQPADGKALAVDNRTYNLLLRSTRCRGERGFA